MNQRHVTLRSERRPLVGWAIGLSLYVLLIGGVYGSIADNQDLDEVYASFPEELREVFGGLDDLSSVPGYLESQLGAYFAIILGVFAVLFMGRHLAGAEESGALDHLLARPLSRADYYWGVVAAGGVAVTGLVLITALATAAGFALSGASLREIVGAAAIIVEFLPIAYAFGAVGAWFGAAAHRKGTSTLAGMAVVFGCFVVDVVGRLVDGLSWLAWTTPNGYRAMSDLYHGAPHLGYVVFCLVWTTVALFIGARIFDRKNLVT